MRQTVRGVIAIAQRDLRSYFSAPLGWILLGLFAFLFGYFYYAYLSIFLMNSFSGSGMPPNVDEGMIRPLFQNAAVLLLFVLPMVTTRSFAEERRSGTIELLLTSPLSDIQILLGKFLAAVGVLSALLGTTLVPIAMLFAFGKPDWHVVVAAYLGLILLGSSLVSMGVLVSSTTNQQVTAGTATFFLALFFWIVSWIADSLPAPLGAVASYLSIVEHFGDFAKGVIDTKHVVFYLTFVGFGLYLTRRSLDTQRWKG